MRDTRARRGQAPRVSGQRERESTSGQQRQAASERAVRHHALRFVHADRDLLARVVLVLELVKAAQLLVIEPEQQKSSNLLRHGGASGGRNLARQRLGHHGWVYALPDGKPPEPEQRRGRHALGRGHAARAQQHGQHLPRLQRTVHEHAVRRRHRPRARARHAPACLPRRALGCDSEPRDLDPDTSPQPTCSSFARSLARSRSLSARALCLCSVLL
jgi:hypothetical protein